MLMIPLRIVVAHIRPHGQRDVEEHWIVAADPCIFPLLRLWRWPW